MTSFKEWMKLQELSPVATGPNMTNPQQAQSAQATKAVGDELARPEFNDDRSRIYSLAGNPSNARRHIIGLSTSVMNDAPDTLAARTSPSNVARYLSQQFNMPNLFPQSANFRMMKKHMKKKMRK